MVLSRNSRLECCFLASPSRFQDHRSTAMGIVRKKRGCEDLHRRASAHLAVLTEIAARHAVLALASQAFEDIIPA